MSNRTSVHGMIEVPRWPGWEDALRQNMDVIDTLPEEGQWPWLVRGMFHATPEIVSYRSRLITFAAAMNGVEEVWPKWLAKFEKLLKQLRWLTVEVHLRTEYVGDHDYVWVALFEGGYTSTGPVSDWEYEGGPRNFA